MTTPTDNKELPLKRFHLDAFKTFNANQISEMELDMLVIQSKLAIELQESQDTTLKLLAETENENVELKERLQEAEKVMTMLANRIADFPPMRRINKDYEALEAYESYKSKER